MQISPQKVVPLIWNSADPNDTDTLFVQAIVKDGRTLTTLDTVNLTDQGSNLFSKDYTAPHDPSQTGTGRWIIVTYTVYTESSYTTKSLNYQRITEKYLVKTLVDPLMLGGGGTYIDYKEVKKAVREVLEEKEKGLEPLVFPEFPMKEVLSGVQKIVESNKPEPIKIKEVDLKPIQDKVEAWGQGIIKSIQSLPPPTKPTDLKPVSQEIQGVRSFVESLVMEAFESQTDRVLKQLVEDNKKVIGALTEEIVKNIVSQMNEGKVRFSLFGEGNPFSQTNEKRENYLKALKAQI